MWTIVQQAFHRNIQMDHAFQQTYPMIPSLQQFLDHRDPTISLPQTNAGTPFDVFVSPRCKPMQRLPHALNLTTGNVWNPWKRYCIRSELSFGAFCPHGRGYKTLKHIETSWNCPTDWSKFQPSASIAPPLWGPKRCTGKFSMVQAVKGKKCPVLSWPIEVGISSSRGHVFGHECWMCQGKPLHTTLWRPMIGGKSQEDAHQ